MKNYSGGMRRRLDIAASIVVTPELMFLDEPTTGLDPRSRNQVWDIIRALVGQGTTVLLCTQYLDEADQLADADRGDRPRQGDRRGHARRAQGVGRPGRAARARCSTRSSARRPSACSPRALDAPVHLEADPAALSVPVGDAERASDAVGELPAPASASRTSRSGSRASTRSSSR